MKKNVWIILTFLLVFALSACSAGSTATAAGAIQEASTGTSQGAGISQSAVESVSEVQAENTDTHEEAGDYAWDESEVIEVQLKSSTISADGDGINIEGSRAAITRSGTYRLNGTLADGQIVVDTKDEDVVRLILNGVDIRNSSSAPIYVKNAEKVVLVLAENSQNALADSASYIYDNKEEEEPNAAVFSKSDLTITGSGALTVQGNFNDAINSKDGLVIAGGSITANAVDDGIRGKDYLVVKDGSITVSAQGDGLKADDALHANGSISINGGTFAIRSGDDGMHADAALTINNGEIQVTDSYEGLESAVITINGGSIQVVSSDDGINVAGGNDGSGGMRPGGRLGQDAFAASGSQYLYINGGTISVDASGDGLDVNGAVTMTAGTVLVNGPTEQMNAALDYDTGFTMTGGVLVAAGSAGMAMAPGENSGQNSLLIGFDSTQPAGSLVHIQNSAGENLLTFAPSKAYQTIVFSSPALVQGDGYKVFTGGSDTGTVTNGFYQDGTYNPGVEYASFSVATPVTRLGSAGMMGPGRGGPGGRRP